MPILSELMKLGNQFDKIMGGLNIDWNGATETIPQARLHWQSQDRTERETSWRLVMAAHAAQGEKLNELYLQMLAQRRQVAGNAGLSDYRAYKWQELARFDYTPADCVTFHDAIEHEVVPLARRSTPSRQTGWGWARSGRGTPTSTRTASRCGRSRRSPIWKKAVTASSTRWIPSWRRTSP